MPETEVIESQTPAVEVPSAPAEHTTESHEPSREAPGAPERTGPSYQDRIELLRGTARQHYRKTGNLEEAERMQGTPRSDANPDSSTGQKPAAAKAATTEPASGPGEPKRPTGQQQNFRTLSQRKDELERENTALRAKLEVYERDRAGSGPSAPAAPKETPQPKAAADPRPEPPNIEDFDDPKKFTAAMKEWHTQDTAWLQRQWDQRLTTEKAQQTYEQATQAWNTQLEKSREVHPDYDAVVFNPKVPLTYVVQGLLQTMPDGALRAYPLAKNMEEATRIAELTVIPGENRFPDFAKFMQWINSDPRLAMLYGEKMAVARMELAKLPVGKVKAPANATPPKPLKEVYAGQPRPSAEVDVHENAAPVGDPVANALRIAKETGDSTEYKRLMNERERQAREQRSREHAARLR